MMAEEVPTPHSIDRSFYVDLPSQTDIDGSLWFLLWVDGLGEKSWKELYTDQGFIDYLNSKKSCRGGAGVFWDSIGSRDKLGIRELYYKKQLTPPPSYQQVAQGAKFFSGVYGAMGIVECISAFGNLRGAELFACYDQKFNRDTVAFYANLGDSDREKLVRWYRDWYRENMLREHIKYTCDKYRSYEYPSWSNAANKEK